VALEHRTTYRFAHPVNVQPHSVRLRPAPHTRTPITAYSLTVSPEHHFRNWQQDPFGNWVARLVFPEPVTELEITVDLVADLTVINPFDFFLESYAEQFPFAYPADLAADLAPYLRPVDEDAPGSGPGPVVTKWLAGQRLAERDTPWRTIDFLVEINGRVQGDVGYSVRMEPGVQTPDQTLTRAIGSCRDSAWLLVSVLRQLGLAARFVSGYLVQLAADQPALDGPNGPSADFTDLHAWAEVFVPGAGWIGLDPTSGLFAGEGHIPLSATPQPASSAPITGATDPVAVEFSFHNTVRRIHEDPRVTLPYNEAQWTEVQALGTHIDGLLDAGDVRLTMGGEPTFVSVDDQSTPQWDTAADGPDKRRLAATLAERLRERWAPGGLVHHGQGKWYPGEALPRWSIQLLWRADGVPLWRDPALLDAPWDPARQDVTPASAAALATGIAARLGVPAEFMLPAFEDPFGRLWDEVRQPAGAPPEADLPPWEPAGPGGPQPAAASMTVAAVDETVAGPGAPSPAGWVIPVFEDPSGDGWGTTRWRLRRGHLFLTAGTSPLGLRLPLGSLGWEPPPDMPDRSPFESRPSLPAEPIRDAARAERPATVHPAESAPRTALTVERRAGHLFVFLPPLTTAERATALVAAIEEAAADVGVPVVLEGYPLPNDQHLVTLSVTPDPGVIEVNVQPTRTWAQLSELTETLYDDARHCRLTTEKFDLDGRHTGTGGGNHFTLGGPTASDSPFLRRPALLRSLLTYWQHHPALSYIFSGRFVGPTSQAPRVDEGRDDRLYELEIAFAELDRVTAEVPDPRPWLVDRLLRHLLTDLTGNTHRSEFCIDKLYSPDSERGRLGLVEMRGFEMPPHARMALVQALLVRALVARFWLEPYAGPLVRWGARLHDRFLLPAFATADLADVIADLNRFLVSRAGGGDPAARSASAGAGKGALFDPAWFDPFTEFRFPRLGEVDVAGVHLELRQAVEPWHVLGEEASATGTARYVDSSVERIQIAATGLVAGRHVVTCNQIPVPLVAAPDPGVLVGGVRFRAWAPSSALHPTLGVHSPLTIDLVDTWSGRSIGGCTYHVAHPGGRNFETYPVNAVEAESRRAARFEPRGHTPGPVDMDAWPAPAARVTGEYPATLDLRRFGPGRS
jgi:uncharacterized protein (DUF2126 family)/transglutaminase-like putative cysteine protease